MNVLLGAEGHRLLSIVVNSAKDLSPTATFRFNAEGFSISCRGDMSSIEAWFSAALFGEYEIPDGGLEFGFDLELLGIILEVSNDKIVRIGKDGNEFSVRINPGTGYESHYGIHTLDSDGILPIQYDVRGSVDMHSEDLANICSHLIIIGEIVRIEFSREYIQFSTTGKVSSSCTARRLDSGDQEQVAYPISFQIGENQLEVPISNDFELKQLTLITNAKDIADTVNLGLTNSQVYPLQGRYGFPNDRGHMIVHFGSHTKSNFSKMVELTVKAFEFVNGNMERADQAIGVFDSLKDCFTGDCVGMCTELCGSYSTGTGTGTADGVNIPGPLPG